MITWLRVFVSSLLWFFLMPRIWRRMAGKRAPSEGFAATWTLLGYGTGICGLLAVTGAFWALLLFIAGVILLMPWIVTRAVLIPLGMSRSAYFLGQLSGWTWGQDMAGGGLVAAAWALLRQREPDRARMTALELRRDKMDSLTAAQVLATGLLSAARGDLDSARLLLRSVDEIGLETTAGPVHALAREWLVVDAAERGAWADAARLARGPRRTRVTRLLGAIGERYTEELGVKRSARPHAGPDAEPDNGPDAEPDKRDSDDQGGARATAKSKLEAKLRQLAAQLDAEPRTETEWRVELWVLWLMAPRRIRTFRLVQRAVQTRPTQPAPQTTAHQPETSESTDLYADALSAHAQALARDPAHFQAADFQRLADAWDRALDHPDTVALVMRRARELGTRSGEAALRALADEVSLDVANMARQAGVRLAECAGDSRILADAQHWLRNDLIRQIELAFDALYDRAAERRSLSSIDEWREFLALRELYRDGFGVGGAELRHLAFPHVHTTVCKLSVWLWNHRNDYLMANAMFRWLLDEARAVGDAEAIELQSRNWDETL